jgi:hypothetical protein
MFAKSLKFTLVLVSAVGVTGCIEEKARVYPYSAQQAMTMLGGGTLPAITGVKSGAAQIPEGGLRWTGGKGRSCEAAIKTVGENQVEITPSCSIGAQEPASELTKQHNELASFAFAEYVYAKMEGRPLDESKIDAKVAATAIQSVNAIGDEIDRYAAESAAREAELKRNAAANAAAASFGKPTGMGDSTFGQPTGQAGN